MDWFNDVRCSVGYTILLINGGDIKVLPGSSSKLNSLIPMAKGRQVFIYQGVCLSCIWTRDGAGGAIFLRAWVVDDDGGVLDEGSKARC